MEVITGNMGTWGPCSDETIGCCAGLVYTRVLQSNYVPRGQEQANNSINYFFCGPEEREREACAKDSPYGPSMDVGLFRDVSDNMQRCNRVVKAFTTLREWDAEEVDFHIVAPDESNETCRVDVCSIVERPQTSIPNPRTVVIFKRNTATGKQKAMVINPVTSVLYEPLTYPMLYFNGEVGWRWGNGGGKMSLFAYTRARLFLPEKGRSEVEQALTYASKVRNVNQLW